MKLVFISDTHGKHHWIDNVPECDILFHCGDMSNRGEYSIYENLNTWLKRVPAKHVVLVPGNHDLTFESDPEEARAFFTRPNTHILINQGTVIEGLKIWGSPTTRRFFDWAFMKDPGPSIQAVWDKIPDGIDVLVTHGPAFGYGGTVRGEDVGCPQLFDAVLRIKPKIHAYGHIHEGAGSYVVKETGTISVNAAFMDGNYRPRHAPTVVEL